MLLVDTNVIIDVFDGDPAWSAWSSRQMLYQSRVHELIINPVIYAELSPGFGSQERLDARMEEGGIGFREMPRSALFIAGLAHRHYRRAGGEMQAVLADFFIGAHAAVLGCGILTRDARRYRNYFPRVPLVTP